MVTVTASSNDIDYTVYGTTDNGCVESASIGIRIIRDLIIYSGLTPNNDGYNDKWVIENAVDYGPNIEVQIFNRWGERIFYSKGYGDDQAWDGTRNGKELPVGTYYYIIKLTNGEGPYTGSITLIR
jgi:gliding motility-associated-like protein